MSSYLLGTINDFHVYVAANLTLRPLFHVSASVSAHPYPDKNETS